jgi:hypothetical protein
VLKASHFSYLWVQNGQRLREDRFSTVFARTFKRYCGADWGLRPYRQGAVSISREFTPPQLHLGGGGDNVADLAADHGTRLSRGNYAVVGGDLPFLTSDAVWEYRVACREWHNICGVGLLPPPEPIRLTRGKLNQLSQNDLKEAVREVVNSSLDEMEKRVIDKLLPALSDWVMSFSNSPPVVPSSLPPSLPRRVLSLTNSRQTISAAAPVNPPGTPSTAAPFNPPGTPPSPAAPIIPSPLPPSSLPTPSSASVIEIFDSPSNSRHSGAPSRLSSVDENPRRGRYRGVVTSSDEIDEQSPSRLRLARRKSNTKSVVLVPSTPESSFIPESTIEARARDGIRQVIGDENAREKSAEQLEALVACLERKEDLNVVLGTGGGKSLLWQATAKLCPEDASIIVVPYKQLLAEHLAKSLSLGIVAFEYKSGCIIPDRFQNVFIQPEAMKGPGFKQ